MKLTETAAKIDAYLRLMEVDSKRNKRPNGEGVRFWNAGALRGGRFVMVCYIRYQGWRSLTREEAERYLAWLDAGNYGKHTDAFR